VIEKRQRRDRKGRAYTVYRVRWKDDAGREHSKTLPRGTKKDDAEDFERRVMTMKRAGALAQLDRGRQPLTEFVPEWWEMYASPNLTAKRCAATRRSGTRTYFRGSATTGSQS
jgi:hypothetical protein